MSETKTTAAKLLEGLAHCHCSETAYRHWTAKITYTEGVKYLAEEAGAYWLIDVVASYQNERVITQNPDLVHFQLWELAVHEDKSATVTMRADSDQPAIVTQEIEFTDFPLDHVTLYVCGGMLLLPSEY